MTLAELQQPATQPELARCGDCGGECRFTPTDSPWEFTYRCRVCTGRGVLSWAHANPPPVFVPFVPVLQQQELFD